LPGLTFFETKKAGCWINILPFYSENLPEQIHFHWFFFTNVATLLPGKKVLYIFIFLTTRNINLNQIK